MLVSIVNVPQSLPPGWDLADPIPEGLDIGGLLESPQAKKTLPDLVFSTAELATMDIPERDCLIEPVIMYPSLNMLYAKRGIGKTWVSLQIAASIASGQPFFSYKTKRAGRVLLVDGEMVLSEIKERVVSLENGISENFDLMPSEVLYRENMSLNLHEDEDRARFLNALEAKEEAGVKYDLIIFDNLSSLCFGVDENDNTEQENFFHFLMGLRHRGHAILVIHHAGKGGDQRGASRREDAMDTVMKLEEPELGSGEVRHQGAHFILKFTKTRGKTPNPQELDIKLVQGKSGKLTWAFSENTYASRADEALRTIQEEKPETQDQLAQIMGCGKSNVSQMLKPLRDQGYLSARGLTVTANGKLRLAELWPDQYGQMAQEEIPF